jgi:hypothetical protein
MGDQSCKLKIILDGGRAAGIVESLCEATQNLSDAQVAILTDSVAYPIINKLIKIEKLADECHNMLLDAVGYDGPRP